MSLRSKRIAFRALVTVVLLVAVPLLVIGSAFVGNAPVVDGYTSGDVRIVKDGYVTVGVVDAGGGKVLLVDAGNDPSGGAILAELARRKLDPGAVSAVFLTHGHRDHTAACHLFPSAKVYALAADVALAEGREGMHSPLGRVMAVHPTDVKVSSVVHDGETVVVGDKSVQVYAVPGHTAGSAAYLVGGVLFLGDSAGAASDGTLKGAPWVFSDDQAANHASLHVLAARLAPMAASVKVLAPAHTGVLQGIGPLAGFSG